MAEDFTTYTEVEADNKITKTATRVTWTNLDRNETAYVYKDKGVDYFNGSFTHFLTVCMTAYTNGSVVYGWALTNDLNSLRVIDTADGDYLALSLFGYTENLAIVISECDGGRIYSDSYTLTLNTVYYLKIVRDESVDDYGTLYCYVYSDAARTTLLDTLSIALHAKKDFRYVHAVNSHNSGETPYAGSGYTENLTLSIPEADPGYVATYPTDAITRVTNLIHRYNRNTNVYTLEMALGEVTTDFGLPEWLTRPQPAVPEEPVVGVPTAVEPWVATAETLAERGLTGQEVARLGQRLAELRRTPLVGLSLEERQKKLAEVYKEMEEISKRLAGLVGWGR